MNQVFQVRLRHQHLLRCVACDHPIGSYRAGDAKGLMTRCSRCKTLQHRHIA